MDKKSLYYAEVGDKVIDTKTGKIWTFKKAYQIDNYAFYQIEREGVIRKLSLFKEEGSIRDVNRYRLVLEK